jgi:hypothetical protein
MQTIRRALRACSWQALIFSRMLLSAGRIVVLAGFISASLGFAQTTLSPNRVTFYTEPNFRGEALTIEAGANVETLDRLKRSDQKPWTYGISSVRIEGAAKATVYTQPGFRGESLEINASVSDLYAVERTSGATWDRAIASINVTGPRVTMVQPAPPPPLVREGPPTAVVVVPVTPPPPPRPRMDPRTAERMVQQAYREVLDRNADPAGLRRYRDRVMSEGWTEGQLIAELQRSGEARAINPDAAITKMYREILGRDPDPSGLAHYRSKWKDGWTQGQIRNDIRRSAEGRDANINTAITRAYRDILGREPDPEGYANYANLMRRQGYTERNIREALMNSDEYRQLHPRR